MMNRVSEIASGLGHSLKAVAKMALQSRKCTIPTKCGGDGRLVILANGPSLNATVAEHGPAIASTCSLAVNFFANTPYFGQLKPNYYVLADPYFFTAKDDANVDSLWRSLAAADWEMVLCVPVSRYKAVKRRFEMSQVKVAGFNFVGIEGYEWLENAAFDLGLAMPRPRNVLIPSIMVAIRAGFDEIYLTGADHSWIETLRVTEGNEVVSVQPHFYEDTREERLRTVTEYKGYRLHDILRSFYVAFRSYHAIERYARHRGVKIYNATPGSYIDAFERRSL